MSHSEKFFHSVLELFDLPWYFMLRQVCKPLHIESGHKWSPRFTWSPLLMLFIYSEVVHLLGHWNLDETEPNRHNMGKVKAPSAEQTPPGKNQNRKIHAQEQRTAGTEC